MVAHYFNRFANWCAWWAGRPVAFISSLVMVVVWALTGPFFHFSDTWQLIINTPTTVITFWLVFVIQNTQNRDSAAIHLKLDELIRVTTEARNELIHVEERDLDEIKQLTVFEDDGGPALD